MDVYAIALDITALQKRVLDESLPCGDNPVVREQDRLNEMLEEEEDTE